jgi:exonuclease VII small subunit
VWCCGNKRWREKTEKKRKIGRNRDNASAIVSALIAHIDKLEQKNAQLKDSMALFQKQIAELQASIAANY